MGILDNLKESLGLDNDDDAVEGQACGGRRGGA